MVRSPRNLLVLSFILFLLIPRWGHTETLRYERSEFSLDVPDVVLLDQDGQKVRLTTLLDSNTPVLVDFIYGTCTTICPILSAGFAHVQKKLGDGSEKVRLVSITIDPENDSPQILKEYASRYKAKPGWHFLTGSRKDIDRVMRAFDAYFSDKMDHQPLTFIRSTKDGRWIRLYGLLTSRDLMTEYENAGGAL